MPDPVRKIPQAVWVTLLLLAALVVTVPVYAFLKYGVRGIVPSRKPLGSVADFYLTEHRGNPFRRADLIGKVWIADFIFTRCQGPCPMMSRNMAKLQKQLPAEVRLVSFSVDPEFDTPEVLKDYAEKYGAVDGRWFFVTAKRSTVYEMIRKNFNLPGQGPHEDGGIVHSDRFVLVDREGAIRGYYDGTSEEDMRSLASDTREILALKKARAPGPAPGAGGRGWARAILPAVKGA